MKPRRAFMTLDVLAGIFLLAALITLLAGAAKMRHSSARQFAAQRDALNVAQATLERLQTREPIVADGNTSIVATKQYVAGREWVEVTVIRDGRRASIIGLVPRGEEP